MNDGLPDFPAASAFDRDRMILNRSLISEILDSLTKLKEKVADKIFWNKNVSVSLSHFLAFQGFLFPSQSLQKCQDLAQRFPRRGGGWGSRGPDLGHLQQQLRRYLDKVLPRHHRTLSPQPRCELETVVLI